MISIVIPAYNEEHRIVKSLQRIYEYVTSKNIDYEIVVIDDGSSDNTGRVLAEWSGNTDRIRKIGYKKNRGKGYALRTGVIASKGDYVLISDADLSTPMEELATLWRALSLRQYEIAIGSRSLPLSRIVKRQPWWRQRMGKVFNRMVRILVMDDFHDTQCGFKLFVGEVARELFREARIDRFAYDVEILFRAKKKGYRIIEVPIRWINSNASRVSPIIDSLVMVKDLFKIRLDLIRMKKSESGKK